MYFGFEHIKIRYDGKTVLEDVTVEFPKGSIVTIIGQNGCGKSSLLKTVSKAVVPKAGKVIFQDKPLSSYPPKELARKIAYLPQVHTSPSDIDVRTLVSYGRYPHSGLRRRMGEEDKKVIEETLALTGLTKLQDRDLATLSGGERQRAWIAMTICQQPEILILDEPTTYLDISYQVEVLELVKQLNQKLGISIIMVLHDLNLAARYSDYLYAICQGQLYAKGKPKEVLTRENLRHLFQIDATICEDKWNQCPYFIPLKTVQ